MTTLKKEHEMTQCQKNAWDLLNGASNVFLTGAAGTGKSYLVQQFLRNKGVREYPIVASTGAAAIIVDGRTFHSFFGLGIMQNGAHEAVQSALRNKQVIRRLNQAVCIVIDEVSMLSGETLEAANEVAKSARMSDEPWGGMRVIAVGDFAQLPPVTMGGAPKDWAFMHSVWRESAFATAQLQAVVRTDEQDFLHILHQIRNGNVTEEVKSFLEGKVTQPDEYFKGTRLFAHRASADRYNEQRLAKLSFQEHVFETHFEGKDMYTDRLKKTMPIPSQLRLKKDALVMIRKNDTQFPYKYINGTLGTVQEVGDDYVLLRTLDGEDIELERTTFSLLDGNGDELASAYNFPLTLAWATTIHKAQGATIDRLMVDLSRLWESGHAYVALSRVPSQHGLSIEKWNPKNIFIDEQVREFHECL